MHEKLSGSLWNDTFKKLNMFLRAITEESDGNGKMLLFPFICLVIYYSLLFYLKANSLFHFISSYTNASFYCSFCI